MQSLAGVGHDRAHAIFDRRANLSRPLTLLDLLEMRIPAYVVKAMVDNLEINAILRHEEQDGGIEVQQMVAAALASLQRVSSDVNGMSVAIDVYTPSSSKTDSGQSTPSNKESCIS